MQYCWYTYAILLVPGRYTFLVPFFQFVYRQYQGEFSDEMQQDSSMKGVREGVREESLPSHLPSPLKPR